MTVESMILNEPDLRELSSQADSHRETLEALHEELTEHLEQLSGLLRYGERHVNRLKGARYGGSGWGNVTATHCGDAQRIAEDAAELFASLSRLVERVAGDIGRCRCGCRSAHGSHC